MLTHAKAVIEKGLEKKLYSAAALGVTRGTEILYREAWGYENFEAADDGDDTKKVTPATRFDLASITKIMNATPVALRFLDRGWLRLDDRVEHFFPEATTVKDITIRQLMTHTSGLPAHFLIQKEVETPEEAIPHILHRPLAHTPGEVEAYSCIGYILLGAILQTISGKTLTELFHDEVATPLGLKGIGYNPDTDSDLTIAETRDALDGSRVRGEVHDNNARFLRGESANAGLFGDLDALMTYGMMLARGGKHGDATYISPATMAAATRNYTPGMAEDRGLGFFLGTTRGSSFGDLCGPGSFGHTGFTGTSLIALPDTETSIVFLSNRVLAKNDGAEALRLRAYLHNAVIAELSGEATRI